MGERSTQNTTIYRLTNCKNFYLIFDYFVENNVDPKVGGN